MKDTERVREPADEPLFTHEDGEPRFETDSSEDLFEEVALPEDESSAAQQFATWREIPADDPSRFVPQTVERWSDQRERFFLPQPKLMTFAALAVTLVVVGGLGYYFGRSSSRPEPPVELSGPRPSPTPAPRAPAATSTVARGAPAVPSVPKEPVPVVRTPEPTPPLARGSSPLPVNTSPLPVTSSPAPAARRPPIDARASNAPDIGVVRTERAATPSAPPVRPAPSPPPPPRAVAATDASASTTPSAPVTEAAVTPAFVPYVPVQPQPLPVPAATAPSAAVSAPAPAANAVADDVRLRELMDRYRTAFASLDANQVRQVWPAVDTRGLSRAFGQLSAQRFEFSGCEISVTGDRGAARCNGTAEYVTKVGSKAPKWDARDWTFDFRRVDQEWRIQSVVTR